MMPMLYQLRFVIPADFCIARRILLFFMLRMHHCLLCQNFPKIKFPVRKRTLCTQDKKKSCLKCDVLFDVSEKFKYLKRETYGNVATGM